MPETTWEQMLEEVRKKFSDEGIYLLHEAVYSAIVSEDKYKRPPKGMLIKHLILILLHWMVKGHSLECYSSDGQYPIHFFLQFFIIKPSI